MCMEVYAFIKKIQQVQLPLVFNPWSDYDPLHDMEPTAPQIRSEQLAKYLLHRSSARYILLAEGLSYQGGKFTGIAMTSERILLGNHNTVPYTVVFGERGARTSCLSLAGKNNATGVNEPTASIVWTAVLDNKIPVEEIVFWNIFPWHPYQNSNMLSNRTPTERELYVGMEYLKYFMKLFPCAEIVCVGASAQKTIKRFTDIAPTVLRHPAHGGANEFRKGLLDFAKKRMAE